MGVSEGLGEHSMLREGESAREEHGDLKACRQLLSIRARLRNATICRIFETPCMDRVSASTSTDPHFGGSKDQGSSPRIYIFDSNNPDPETFSSSLSETKDTATQWRENEEEGHLSRPGMSQKENVQDRHVTAFESSSEGEDHARQVDNVQGCQRLITHEGYSPKLAAKKSLECCLVLDDEDDQQECRSASEAVLGLSRRLAGAESLRRKEVMMIMERLYRDHPGAVWRRTSREAIKAVEAQGREPECAKVLIYGEISFIAFTKLLEMYAPKTMAPVSARSSLNGKKDSQADSPSSGFTFYDLGCGAGRPVFMASLLMTSCVKSCGVEIIPSMHQMNKELLQLYDVEVRKWLHPAKQAQNITFLCGDMLQVDWSDADIVFANATCFDDILFGNLEARAKNILKEGAIVIVVTRRFKSDSVWEVVNETERRMSWSPAVVSVYRKKTQTLELPIMVETRE